MYFLYPIFRPTQIILVILHWYCHDIRMVSPLLKLVYNLDWSFISRISPISPSGDHRQNKCCTAHLSAVSWPGRAMGRRSPGGEVGNMATWCVYIYIHYCSVLYHFIQCYFILWIVVLLYIILNNTLFYYIVLYDIIL